ncbi:serine protease SP24D-like isoform X4 [Rhagoletis pomonella]|uniref:serine protease SP24D-like isoform X3 n=1 Tax=Rhagoletis pomonella TaxID=28610 RepID=UPI0017854A65|nr:serine protease SP24D-like isoform X3 [Rhagoletis pomonella]XP_036319183.1 serine protease SP24D-like isoform X4 [Rhagoletis pomonella]
MEQLACFVKLLILICLISEAVQVDNVLKPVVVDSSASLPRPRIVGGLIAASGQFPYQVSVRVGGRHSCGGAILSQDYIITAAHCVISLPTYFVTVNAGSVNSSVDGVVAGVSEIIIHPDFSYTDSDIALLKLNVSLQFTDLIKPIALAGVSPPTGAYATISGWGRTREGGPLSELLMYNRYVRTLSNDDCARAIGYKSAGILCLAKSRGNGICGGDQGGPAVYNGVLIGIASYHKLACGTDEPDGYIRISTYRKWLIDVSTADSGVV